MPTEWFREPGWSEEDRVEFERRLARARPSSRAQYLAIKAASILAAGHARGGRDLFERVLTDYPEDWLMGVRAIETLGDLTRDEGDLNSSNDYYRKALAVGRNGSSGTSGMIEVSLAENLIKFHDAASLDEATILLERWVRGDGGIKFDSQLFRFQIALIRLAKAMGGDAEVERDRARAARALVGRGPTFTRHPTVGLVQADDATLAWLMDLANRT